MKYQYIEGVMNPLIYAVLPTRSKAPDYIGSHHQRRQLLLLQHLRLTPSGDVAPSDVVSSPTSSAVSAVLSWPVFGSI